MGVKKSREIHLFAKSTMQGTVGCMEDKKNTHAQNKDYGKQCYL